MFAVVRAGGKQYRVAPGDKIVVEKLDGNAGDSIRITDILLAGEGSELKSVEGLVVGAEIIAQAKADKVTVFKKRRRHNYRRKAGHRQQHTILRIVSIGDQKEQKKAAPAKAVATPPAATAVDKPAAAKPIEATAPSKAESAPPKPVKVPKPVEAVAGAPAKTSTKDAAPAKAALKKTPKAK